MIRYCDMILNAWCGMVGRHGMYGIVVWYGMVCM